MGLVGNPNGTLLVEPSPGNSLVIFRDPDEMVVIGEMAAGE